MLRDPYEVLGLPQDAGPEEIRRQYLALVRQYPPEREPQRFAEIREAYDNLRDPIVTLRGRLLGVSSTVTFAELLQSVRPDVRRERIATEVLLTLGR
jgi:preprotein translocase subunit Sec63